MKSDNELIAEFMGYEYRPSNEGLRPFGWVKIGSKNYLENNFGPNNIILCRVTKHMMFDSSWDWLMPVVEKIETIAPTDVKEINNEGLAIFELGLMTPIEELYKAVVEFIKWYNSKETSTNQ